MNEIIDLLIALVVDGTLQKLTKNGGRVIETDWDKVNNMIFNMIADDNDYAQEDNITVWNTTTCVHIRINK